jgi:UDP-2,3-diacylglucosamine pyrophosphatase LpxH
MITSIRSPKMVVISDLHMGNPFSKTTMQTMRFLRWAASEGYDICINGDGLEMAQASVGKMMMERLELA